MQKHVVNLLAICFSFLSLTAPALALPFQIGNHDFTRNATNIDLYSVGNETQISNQLTGIGVSFSGALYGMTSGGDKANFPCKSTDVIASNWLYSQNKNAGLSFEAFFSAPVNKIGFYLENWPTQIVTVEIFSGLTSLGSIGFTTSSIDAYAEFKGLQNLVSFDRLVFTNTDSINGFFAIDDFQFETNTNNPVPEPSTIVLLTAGILCAAFLRIKINV